jgi:linoleoyl-CoA desaturase
VEATAKEFDIPYKSAKTFVDALVGHGRLLKELGKKPTTALKIQQVATAA